MAQLRIFTALTVVGLLFSTPVLAEKTQLDLGEEAPGFRLRVLNAKEAQLPNFDIADVAGSEAEQKKKAVLLSFFATYCEPCKKELPFLQALHEEYGPKGLQIVSISIDKDDDKVAQVRELIDKNKLTFPVLSDRFQAVGKRYYVAKLPCLYTVDPDKNVAKVSIGYESTALRDLVADVRTRLGLPTNDPLPAKLAAFIREPGPAVAATPAAVRKKKHK